MYRSHCPMWTIFLIFMAFLLILADVPVVLTILTAVMMNLPCIMPHLLPVLMDLRTILMDLSPVLANLGTILMDLLPILIDLLLFLLRSDGITAGFVLPFNSAVLSDLRTVALNLRAVALYLRTITSDLFTILHVLRMVALYLRTVLLNLLMAFLQILAILMNVLRQRSPSPALVAIAGRCRRRGRDSRRSRRIGRRSHLRESRVGNQQADNGRRQKFFIEHHRSPWLGVVHARDLLPETNLLREKGVLLLIDA